jgi:hypothetical protein
MRVLIVRDHLRAHARPEGVVTEGFLSPLEL